MPLSVFIFLIIDILFLIDYCDLIIGYYCHSLRVPKNASKTAARKKFFRQMTIEGFLSNRPLSFVVTVSVLFFLEQGLIRLEKQQVLCCVFKTFRECDNQFLCN